MSEIADAFARPAAMGIALFIALVLIRGAPAILQARLAALSAAGTAAYLACSSGHHTSVWMLAIVPLCIFNSVFFWWFVRSLFEDDFRLGRMALLPLPVMAALGLSRFATAHGHMPTLNAALVLLHGVIITGLVGHLFYSAWSGLAGDLVETRRRFRVLFLGAGGIVAITTAVAEFELAGRDAPAWLLALQSAVFLALLAWAGASVLALGPGALSFEAGPSGRAPPRHEQPAPGAIAYEAAAADEAPLRAELQRLMETGQLFREHGLTIAGLAQRLKVPEHRLRRLINHSLGHRNFNQYLNSLRIRWAKSVLADPSQARLPILTIAYDAGFASIAPFNRAFREAEGESPSDYRARMLGRGQIDSEKI